MRQKGEKVSLYIVSGSVPEPGQRGATQDRMLYASWDRSPPLPFACLAQLVERMTFNHVVVGSSPTAGIRRVAQWISARGS